MLPVLRIVRCRSPAHWTNRLSTIRRLSNEPDQVDRPKPFESIPGPRGLYTVPYLGTLLHFKPFTDIPIPDINTLQKRLHGQYGDMLKFRAGDSWMVAMYHPDLCRQALQVQTRLPERFPIWILKKYSERMGIEEGVGTVNGEKWEALRKPLQKHVLRPNSLASYAPIINEVADAYISSLKEQNVLEDTLLSLYNYAIENVGMLIFHTRLGFLDGAQRESEEELIRNVEFAFDALEKDLRSPFHFYRFFRTPFYNKFEKSLNNIKRTMQPVVDETVAKFHALKARGDIEDHAPCLIFSLLGDGQMTEAQLNTFIVDFFLSGIDSTAKTMSMVLQRLARHQDKQQKLYEEIEARGLTKGRPLTNHIIGSMPYLKACIKESMRMHFPISGGYVTTAQRNMVIGGYEIPEKTLLMVASPTMIQDSRFFSDFNEYIPERWLRTEIANSATSKTLNSFAFIPFGFGKRSCIGQRFAERELQIGITKMIQNFRVTLPPGITEVPWEYRMFATPSGKLTLHLNKRDNISQ